MIDPAAASATPSFASSCPPPPPGFFEDKKADARVRGEVPQSAQDLTREYAEFMKQVEVDSQVVAAQLAADQEDEAAGRLDREDFEQL